MTLMYIRFINESAATPAVPAAPASPDSRTNATTDTCTGTDADAVVLRDYPACPHACYDYAHGRLRLGVWKIKMSGGAPSCGGSHPHGICPCPRPPRGPEAGGSSRGGSRKEAGVRTRARDARNLICARCSGLCSCGRAALCRCGFNGSLEGPLSGQPSGRLADFGRSGAGKRERDFVLAVLLVESIKSRTESY